MKQEPRCLELKVLSTNVNYNPSEKKNKAVVKNAFVSRKPPKVSALKQNPNLGAES